MRISDGSSDVCSSDLRGPLPNTATRVDRMSRKLHTKAGAAVYAARKAIVEPVIGQIKQARGFVQFLLRGIEKVQGERSDERRVGQACGSTCISRGSRCQYNKK